MRRRSIERFTAFVQQHNLNSAQTRFLDLLQNHIAKIRLHRGCPALRAAVHHVHTDSLDGLFPDEGEVDAIIKIIESVPAAERRDAVA